jgi:hypothetical protein
MNEVKGNLSVNSSGGAPNCADQQAGSNVGLPVGGARPATKKDAGIQTSMTRRGLLRGGLQAAGAAALAVLTGALVRRNLLAGPSAGGGEPPCDNRFICRGCGRLESCGLPQALSARQALGGRAT